MIHSHANELRKNGLDASTRTRVADPNVLFIFSNNAIPNAHPSHAMYCFHMVNVIKESSEAVFLSLEGEL